MRPTPSTALLACAILVLGSTLLAETTGSAEAESASEPAAPAEPLRPLASKDTLSVDFPDEDIRAIIRNVGDLFSLKIDFPQNIQGRTSLKLRDVTWRQIFKVVLTPLGYDFYERDGVVVIRTKEEIDALPPLTQIHELFYQTPEEIARFLNGLYLGRAQFSAAENAVVYRAHPRDVEPIKAEILRVDRASVRLHPFPRPVFFPQKLPDLKPIPDPMTELTGKTSDLLSTEVFQVTWVDAFAIAAHMRKELPGKESRVWADHRTNLVVVSAPNSAMPRLAAIVAYLDDKRWYQARPTETVEPAPTPLP